jgi:hypothetical protein
VFQEWTLPLPEPTNNSGQPIEINQQQIADAGLVFYPAL